jgi:hypothetical protein
LPFSLLGARPLTGASMRISLKINGLNVDPDLFQTTAWMLEQYFNASG